MSRRLAWTLVVCLIVMLLVGTQMPNGVRRGIENSVGAPFPLSSWAHLVVFMGLGLLLAIRPLAWSFVRIVALAFVLAVMSEGLQFFAIDRHPRLIDIVIDLTGTFIGLFIATRLEKSRKVAG